MKALGYLLFFLLLLALLFLAESMEKAEKNNMGLIPYWEKIFIGGDWELYRDDMKGEDKREVNGRVKNDKREE